MNVGESQELLGELEQTLAAEPDPELRGWYRQESALQPDIATALQAREALTTLATRLAHLLNGQLGEEGNGEIALPDTGKASSDVERVEVRGRSAADIYNAVKSLSPPGHLIAPEHIIDLEKEYINSQDPNKTEDQLVFVLTKAGDAYATLAKRERTAALRQDLFGSAIVRYDAVAEIYGEQQDYQQCGQNLTKKAEAYASMDDYPAAIEAYLEAAGVYELDFAQERRRYDARIDRLAYWHKEELGRHIVPVIRNLARAHWLFQKTGAESPDQQRLLMSIQERLYRLEPLPSGERSNIAVLLRDGFHILAAFASDEKWHNRLNEAADYIEAQRNKDEAEEFHGTNGAREILETYPGQNKKTVYINGIAVGQRHKRTLRKFNYTYPD